MDDGENKKTPEELTDEALDAVAGEIGEERCPKCHTTAQLEWWHDPDDPALTYRVCAGCASVFGYVK